MIPPGSVWEVLGLARDAAPAEVKRRYAALIKQFRPDTHPEDFARIRAAYELALQIARDREAQAAQLDDAPVDTLTEVTDEALAHDAASPIENAQAEPATQAPHDPVVTAPWVDAPPLVADRASTHDLASPPRHGTAGLGTSLPPAVEWARLRQQAHTEGEPAALPALRALLATRKALSLDDREALEFAVLRGVLDDPAPPLLLLFEAGRWFGWHERAARLDAWIGPAAAHRLALLLTLSRDEVFARYGAGNRWLRRLFTPAGNAPWVGMDTAMHEARAWEQRWRLLAAQLNLPRLLNRLNPRVSDRLAGHAVRSTDLGAVLLLAGSFAMSSALLSFDAQAFGALLLGLVLGAALVGLLRVLAARARAYAAAPPHDTAMGRTVRWVQAHPWRTLCGAIAVLAAPTGIGLAADMPGLVEGALSAELAVVGTAMSGLVLRVLWWFACSLERVVTGALQWREAVDRWEHAQRLQAPPQGLPTDARAPFGPRLSGWQRLRHIRPAYKLQAEELQRHDRPPRARAPRLLRRAEGRVKASGGSSFLRYKWWWIWIALVVVRGIASLHS